MAGKTKKRAAADAGPAVVTPKAGMGGNGHLGLKSSPYCVTDAKLTSQMMVRDRMNAHYKKLARVKPSVDASAPKSMSISTKKRDQIRRQAAQSGVTPRSARKQSARSRPQSRAQSELDRQELLNAYASINDEYYQRNDKGSLEAHPPSDLTHELSRLNDTYSRPNSARLGKTFQGTMLNDARGSRTAASPHSTPRNCDILETRKHVFTDTENKQFQPRILKTNQTSRLSQLRLYNPPKKISARSPSPDGKQMTMRSAMTSQTMTSTELMNESLMSRDINQARSPAGIPPLDISLDKDHLKWLKEQSLKTPTRTIRSHRPDQMMTRNFNRLNSTTENDRNKTLSTGRVPLSPTLFKVAHEEEELKYLDFIRDVTNDVLDRGIFTDRVLKKVFNAHIEKRKHELDVARMQEMVGDLREDLNIPENDLEETTSEKPKAYLGRQRSSSPGQRPPIPKAKTNGQATRSFVESNTKKDINENIVSEFDSLKITNGYEDISNDYKSKVNGHTVTLDDVAEPTARSATEPDEETFRNIAPAVSSAVKSGTFGNGYGSGRSSPKSNSVSRQHSCASAKSGRDSEDADNVPDTERSKNTASPVRSEGPLETDRDSPDDDSEDDYAKDNKSDNNVNNKAKSDDFRDDDDDF